MCSQSPLVSSATESANAASGKSTSIARESIPSRRSFWRLNSTYKNGLHPRTKTSANESTLLRSTKRRNLGWSSVYCWHEHEKPCDRKLVSEIAALCPKHPHCIRLSRLRAALGQDLLFPTYGNHTVLNGYQKLCRKYSGRLPLHLIDATGGCHSPRCQR